ncbi:MAG: hypothetical protein COW01_16020 [Bdellovibrionales bacterium CG12_big_fil_rev_8_21_14_0_65_38_15]|nr:MAG: hypothetical protein COW79_15185 [Bdellovibrionales bacterium CG22_combo_CG10-13_8_21_14_all_38_13]PIQ52473.1 MAG: hypothetical protein COW01_16020 [Bdellovibrionales bacterium CG12_big_fil_rev_8_21_14_0_65_38_15]PIR29511.1 MAG: hypothetical protein COV38_10560 [Bdellovibrionales bacterium CG11_big_fil_rev_8_21_14_0_20_38_13]
MKSLLLGVTLLFSANGFAASTISQNAAEICKLAVTCESFQTESSTVKEMIKEYYLEMDGEELADEYYDDSNSMFPGIDDITWGTFSMKQALDFVTSHGDEDFASDETPSKAELYKINGHILNMRGTGVEFGFTSNTGGSVCGVVFPGLLIIDTKSQTIYDVTLFGYPEC